MACDLSLYVVDLQSGQDYYHGSRSVSTYLGPKSGTLSLQGSGVLPPGGAYSFHYMMRMDTTGSSGQFGNGTGSVSFTFQPVPEPATALPAALVLLAVSYRRHRRRG